MALSNDIVQEIRIQVRNENAKKAFSDTSKSIITLNQALELAQKAFRAMGAGAKFAMDALDRGEVVTNLNRGFETLQANAGLLASDSLQKLRVATRGLTSDMELMQAANTAAQLGLPIDELDKLAEAARKVGETVGRTATEAFGDLITGVGRASPLILDNLGIIVRAEEAYKQFATANNIVGRELSDLEKKLAFQAAAIEAVTEKAATLDDVNLNAAQAFSKLGTTISNATDEFVKGFAASEDLSAAIQGLSNGLDDLDFFTLGREIAGAIAPLVEFAATVKDLLVDVGFLNNTSMATLENRRNVSDIISGSRQSNTPDRGIAQLAAQYQDLEKQISETLTRINKAEMESAKAIANFDIRAGLIQKGFADQQREFLSGLKTQQADTLAGIKSLEGAYRTLNDGQDRNKQTQVGVVVETKKAKENIEAAGTQLVKSADIFGDIIDAALSGDSTINLERGLLKAASKFAEALFSGDGLDAAGAGLMDAGLTAGIGVAVSGLKDTIDDLSDGIDDAQEAIRGLSALPGSFAVGANNALGGPLGDREVSSLSGSIGLQAAGLGPLGLPFIAANQLGVFDSLFGSMTAEESALKSIEGFLEDRLSNAGGVQLGGGLSLGDNIEFGKLEDFETGWSDAFATVENEGFLAFDSVGKAINQMLDTGEEVGGALGFILSENLGGDVNNLRLFVQGLDIDIKQLEESMIAAGKKGEESWSAVDSALEGISMAAGEGLIAVGDIAGAFEQLVDSGGRGAFALQAVENIAIEAIESGATSLEQVKQQMLASGQFTEEQVSQLFGAFAAEGISSFEQLKDAGDRTFIGVVAELERAGFQFSEWREDIGASTESMKELGSESEQTERSMSQLERRASSVGAAFREAQSDVYAFRQELSRTRTESGNFDTSENVNAVG